MLMCRVVLLWCHCLQTNARHTFNARWVGGGKVLLFCSQHLMVWTEPKFPRGFSPVKLYNCVCVCVSIRRGQVSLVHQIQRLSGRICMHMCMLMPCLWVILERGTCHGLPQTTLAVGLLLYKPLDCGHLLFCSLKITLV